MVSSQSVPPSVPSDVTSSPPPSTPVVTPTSGGSKETPSLFRRKEEKQEERSEPSAPKKENDFDQASVERFWKLFGEQRLNDGAGDAEKLVLGRSLTKKEGAEISILLGSQLEINILEKFEQDLVQFLRKELENDFVFISKEVKAQQEGQKLYTSQDKFDFMVKENPSLQKLKEKLGLDFEY